MTALIYTNATMAAKYLYDPYGNTLAQSGPLAAANAYRFSSKEWDANAGLYYYLYRFYDPNLQRWPNRDPLAESENLNLYVFASNNPLNELDINGLGLWNHIKKYIKCKNAMQDWKKKCLAAWPKECPASNNASEDAFNQADYYSRRMDAMLYCVTQSQDMFRKCMEAAYEAPVNMPPSPNPIHPTPRPPGNYPD